MRHEDFTDVAKLPARYTDKMLHDKINEVIGLLKGPSAAIALLLCATAFGAGVTVQTAPKDEVFNDEPIVTNVVFDATGLATTGEVESVRVAIATISDSIDFSPSNATLVATIEATAPAPGNYAAVSNRAMTALQSFTETDPTVPAWAKATSKPSYSWSEITSKPSLATVATSGSYNDLSNKPTIPTVPTAQINAATTTNALQDAAIAGKADKADATLTELGYSDWSILHTPLTAAFKAYFYNESEDAAQNDYAVTIRGTGLYVGGYLAAGISLSSDELTGSFNAGSPEATSLWGPIGTTVATRTAESGYQLGNDTTHILAAQTQMDELGSSIATNAAAIKTLSDSIPSVALTNETLYVNGWKTNVVTRRLTGAVDLGPRKPNTMVGQRSIVLGLDGTASGGYSCAEGNSVTASGNYSHAEGNFATASGNYSHAEGNGIASGDGSHAEGNSIASGYFSHAEGGSSTAGGQYSHAAGFRAVTALSGFLLSPITPHDTAWCWQGHTNTTDTTTARPHYHSHGHGTFNINPVGGVDGFWIGETNFTQHVRNIAGSGGGGSAAPKRVAMFVIPVNESGSFTYKGFELKCSTNNFASAASESVKLQFYSQSEIADEGSGSTIDKMKLFACTSYWSGRDRRSYSPIGNTIDYGNDLYSVVALVDVSCLKRHPEDNGAWLNEDNEDLVWCYMRDTANDVEREQLTTEPLWRPIAPVRWFSKMPAWAN